MKKCPFCAEDIQDEAIKCKHCGEFLSQKPAEKWYFQPAWLVLIFLFLGPLALPLVWVHPRLNRRNKGVITIIVLILTGLIGLTLLKAVRSIWEYYSLIF